MSIAVAATIEHKRITDVSCFIEVFFCRSESCSENRYFNVDICFCVQ